MNQVALCGQFVNLVPWGGGNPLYNDRDVQPGGRPLPFPNEDLPRFPDNIGLCWICYLVMGVENHGIYTKFRTHCFVWHNPGFNLILPLLVMILVSPEKCAVSYQLIVLLTTKELQNRACVLEVTWGTATSASCAKCACVIGGGLMLIVDLVGIACSKSDTGDMDGVDRAKVFDLPLILTSQ